MTVPNIAVINLGRIGYLTSLQIQKKISSSLKMKPNHWNDGILLLMEYPHLYTVGIRNKEYTIDDEQRLRKLGAEFYRTDRGGLITYHGPGQLVVYPVIDLKSWHRPHSIRWFINSLEETVINMSECLGVSAHRYHPYPGIWVREEKLCAIGVHASRHVTTHGIAINCNTNLSWFQHIVPCGIEGKGVTSFSEVLKKNVKIDDVVGPFLTSFKTIFSCKLVVTDLKRLEDNFYSKNVTC